MKYEVIEGDYRFFLPWLSNCIPHKIVNAITHLHTYIPIQMKFVCEGVSCLAPSNYPNQHGLSGHCFPSNTLECNFNQNTWIINHENSFEDVVACRVAAIWFRLQCVNSLRPTPNRRHFADDIFKCISENENE